MSGANFSRLRDLLKKTVGPAPWYWETFAPMRLPSGETLVWRHHGNEGPLGYLVSLVNANDSDKPLLALNTYCRPFAVPPARLGIWCPEGRQIRLCCFDAAELKAFDLTEIAGWFKQSSERIYAATTPAADFEVRVSLAPGMNKLEVPSELQGVEELIVPTSYPAKSADDPAMALYAFYLHAGLVEVLPQKWFTAAQYQVGRQWIARAARDPESHRIFGECFGAGNFLLEEDGCRLASWIDKTAG